MGELLDFLLIFLHDEYLFALLQLCKLATYPYFIYVYSMLWRYCYLSDTCIKLAA